MEISKRIQDTELSFTVALRIEADKRKAKGNDIIDLGLGDIQFGQPPKFTKALIKAAKKGVNVYTAPGGALKLRKSIAKANNELYEGQYKGKIIQPKFTPEEIVHATSAKLLIYASAISVANPGDEIIMLAPYWPSYVDSLKLGSIVPKICYTKFENNSFPTEKQLSKLVAKKTKAIIVNTPNNPTGRVYTKDELKIIADFATKHDLLIISDEVYDTIVFDNNIHYSIASLSKSVANRTVAIKGLSKGFGMGGMRFGYAMSKNKEIVLALNKVVSNTITSAPSLLQEAGPALFLESVNHVMKVRDGFKKRVEFTEKIFREHDLPFTKVEGAPYIFPNVSQFFSKKMPGSLEFMQQLINKTGVVVLHGGICGNDNHVRIALIQNIPTLNRAWEKLFKFGNR